MLCTVCHDTSAETVTVVQCCCAPRRLGLSLSAVPVSVMFLGKVLASLVSSLAAFSWQQQTCPCRLPHPFGGEPTYTCCSPRFQPAAMCDLACIHDLFRLFACASASSLLAPSWRQQLLPCPCQLLPSWQRGCPHLLHLSSHPPSAHSCPGAQQSTVCISL